MELTKHAHAAVVLEKDGASIAIDAGTYTPTAADVIAAASAVLITHAHPDHFDASLLTGDIPVFGPQGAIDVLGHGTAVGPGDSFEVAGFSVQVFGGKHAIIWNNIPDDDNVTFLVDGVVYHPGDSFDAPGVPVDTLLVPTSGPWFKLGEAIDFVRAVSPRQSVQIHELMASDGGQTSSARALEGYGGAPFVLLPVGESITIP